MFESMKHRAKTELENYKKVVKLKKSRLCCVFANHVVSFLSNASTAPFFRQYNCVVQA